MTDNEITLQTDGMHCEACVRRLTLALQKLSSVQVQAVSVGSAKFSFDPSTISLPEIEQAIQKIGFKANLNPVNA
jgi:copper chaperone